MALLSYIIFIWAVLHTTLAQSSANRCANDNGVCSYNLCSRYYVSSTSAQLCPNPYQRCCVAERCLTVYGGNCQSSQSSCSGSSYTHDSSFYRLCQQSTDSCCITSMPGRATTTPSPTLPPATSVTTDKCVSYGGQCADQTKYRCDNGVFRLLGDNSQVLCNKWYSNNERCCMADNSGSTGGRVSPTPASPSTTVQPSNPVSSTKSGCGVSKVSLTNKRIVGGNTAEKGEWPWQASIIKSTSVYGRSFSHTCGGTLISSQWVISAAHCFQSVTNQYQIRVRVGEHSFYVDEGTEDSVIVSNIIVHPSYVHSANKNDIAMIKLSKPVDLTSKYLSTACLPDISDMDEFYKTSECYTTGWGKTQGTSGDSNILQEVQSTLVSQSSCYAKWGYKIDGTKVCFGNGYKGACQGDSGGPLVCKKDGLFHLVGVVSYGSKSCVERYVPTVFTNVAAYRSWIEQVMASYF